MEIITFDTQQRLSTIISPHKYTQRHSNEGCLSSSKNLWRRLLEANRRQVPLKSYSLRVRIDSVDQISRNKEKAHKPNITSKYWPESQTGRFHVYIHVYQMIKNWKPGPINCLRHADNRKHFSGLSLTRNRREAHMARAMGKIWRCSCWEKGNFISICEFKYSMVRLKKFDHLHLVYHFTVPLKVIPNGFQYFSFWNVRKRE